MVTVTHWLISVIAIFVMLIDEILISCMTRLSATDQIIYKLIMTIEYY